MEKILHTITSPSHPSDRPLIVAISGFSSSGKTTFANKLTVALQKMLKWSALTRLVFMSGDGVLIGTT